MATAIAGILGVMAGGFLALALWGAVRNNERLRAQLDDAEREYSAKLAEFQQRVDALPLYSRENRILEQKLAKKEQEIADLRVLHEAQRAERKSIMAEMRENYGARVTTEAQVEQAARLVPLMERTADAVTAIVTHAAQREANLRNDVEAERVLAVKSLDSLTTLATQLVTLSTEMAGLQRIGFRPPVKESGDPQPSVVKGLPSVEDVDAELMQDHPEMAARYD